MPNPRQIKTSLKFVLLLTVAAFAVGCRYIADPKSLPPADEQISSPKAVGLLPFGNPSNAATTDEDNYLISHRSHVLSYNNSRGTLNWASWWTKATDLGDSIERPLFEPDPLLPRGMRKIGYYDYSGSGYDRGHIVPAADRFGDRSLFKETFLMTNIVPQSKDLNQFPWNKLEMDSRILARNNDLYTIAGAYGSSGRLKGKVTVPTNCWKVIVVLPQRSNSINASTRIIAVDMPNIDGIEDMKWESYRTTVREIEQKTGLDLFSSIPKELQEKIETKRN